MSKSSLLASGTSAFAHLIKGRPAAAPAGSAPPPAPGAKAEDDEMTDDEKRRKKNKDEGRDEDDDGESAKPAKGKKAKAEGDDASDDEDDEDDADADSKAIRARERARCAAIFRSPAAGKRPDMAAHLAFETGLNRTAAVSMLEAIAAGEPEPVQAAKPGVHARMQGVKQPDTGQPGGGASPNADPAAATADFILNAGKKARGEK